MKVIQNKSEHMKALEKQTGEPIEKTLHRLYVIQNKSANQIASELNQNQRIICKWLRFMGIKDKFDRDKFIKLLNGAKPWEV